MTMTTTTTDPWSYDSLHDPNLQTYFGKQHVRRHLQKSGLITRRGEIVPRREYEATINERYRQEHVKALLSHGVVQRVIELEKSRQANTLNQFEIVAKRINVENIKESREHYRQSRSSDLVLLNRPKTGLTINNQKSNQNKERSSRLSARIDSPTRHKSPRITKSDVNGKDRCQITMIHLGPQVINDYNQSLFQSNGHEIVVMQQHCGGENILLFKNNIKSNEKFTFQSRRHSEYPFALTLYVDGIIDCRISVCCEYKHKNGVPLGGRRASFAILNVEGGKPCLRCRFNEYMANSPLLNGKSNNKSSICTDTSKYETTPNSDSHRLLRTPSPIQDEPNSETIISNPKDELSEAKEMYESLIKKLGDDLNWEERSSLHYQLGNICSEGLSDVERSLEHYLISLEIQCQHISSMDKKLRNLYLTIGHLLRLQGKFQKDLSIKYFQRILHMDYLTKNVYFISNDHFYLGLLYKNEENFRQSLFHFKKCLKYFLLIKSDLINEINLNNETIYDKKVFESLSTNNLLNISQIHFYLATIYENVNEKGNAVKHAQKAAQLSTTDQNNFNIYQNYLNKLRHS